MQSGCYGDRSLAAAWEPVFAGSGVIRVWLHSQHLGVCVPILVQTIKKKHTFTKVFFFSFLLFFSTLKEGSILVFPKREQQQQQGNEVASKFGPVPGTAQFSRLPYKNPGGKSVEAVGSFLLGSGGLWSDKRTLPQSPVYDWSVAERENTPNFFSSLASKSLHV